MTGAEVREIRLSLGASYRVFAKTLGVVPSSVLNWERRGVEGATATLLRLLRDKPLLWKWIRRSAT